ncbi:hypothetical protein ACH5RR_041113 [Cinchona calisaya]|uniref:Uncharacterized protein n=1 Tax=Cinchona calisaya TaxID=153742 RepID=A0ABD2XSZ9_9GENT
MHIVTDLIIANLSIPDLPDVNILQHAVVDDHDPSLWRKPAHVAVFESHDMDGPLSAPPRDFIDDLKTFVAFIQKWLGKPGRPRSKQKHFATTRTIQMRLSSKASASFPQDPFDK